MSDTEQYLTGLGIAITVSLAVVVYLRPHLRAILRDLCGTPERAAFWLAFSNVALALFPLLFAIYRWPDVSERGPVVHAVGLQVGAAIGGLLTAMITLGIVLSMFISAHDRRTVRLPGEAPRA